MDNSLNMKNNVQCVFCKHSYFVSHPCLYEEFVTVECEYFHHPDIDGCPYYENVEYVNKENK